MAKDKKKEKDVEEKTPVGPEPGVGIESRKGDLICALCKTRVDKPPKVQVDVVCPKCQKAGYVMTLDNYDLMRRNRKKALRLKELERIKAGMKADEEELLEDEE